MPFAEGFFSVHGAAHLPGSKKSIFTFPCKTSCNWGLVDVTVKGAFAFISVFQVLVLFGRAVNIFPLSYLLNFFRDHKITPKMMFIMWFSGKLQLKILRTGKKPQHFISLIV